MQAWVNFAFSRHRLKAEGIHASKLYAQITDDCSHIFFLNSYDLAYARAKIMFPHFLSTKAEQLLSPLSVCHLVLGVSLSVVPISGGLWGDQSLPKKYPSMELSPNKACQTDGVRVPVQKTAGRSVPSRATKPAVINTLLSNPGSLLLRINRSPQLVLMWLPAASLNRLPVSDLFSRHRSSSTKKGQKPRTTS